MQDPKSINDRATIREYEEALEAGNAALAKRIREANPDLFPFQRALIQVSGGVAYVTVDPGVKYVVVDYDNDPDTVVPVEFADLARL